MQITSIPIPEPQSRKLHSWLNQPEFDTLIEVLQTMKLEHESKCADNMVQADAGKFPLCEAQAKDDAQKAGMIHSAIAALKALKSVEKFTTATAKPN